MPADEYPRYFPLGDSAMTVEFGRVINEELNQRAIEVAEYFDRHPFPGYVESIPAYSSTTVFYDPVVVRRTFVDLPTAYDAVLHLIKSRLSDTIPADDSIDREPTIIPVDFSPRSGLDLEHVAQSAAMTVEEVISIFTAATYRVYMLGFLPGFSYMGEVDERIATGRKATPRINVPKGSVGIAGRQTGIYSLGSPGGWQIIGRTDLDMFTPLSDQPCRLKPGDRVNFIRL